MRPGEEWGRWGCWDELLNGRLIKARNQLLCLMHLVHALCKARNWTLGALQFECVGATL